MSHNDSKAANNHFGICDELTYYAINISVAKNVLECTSIPYTVVINQSPLIPHPHPFNLYHISLNIFLTNRVIFSCIDQTRLPYFCDFKNIFSLFSPEFGEIYPIFAI